MSEGWIKLHRQIWECWLWDKPVNRFQAWVDLLLLANHQEGKSEKGGSVVMIGRGQVLTSLAKLADRWGWSVQNVRTFLKLLESDEKLTRKSTNAYTLITLVNYDAYQGMLTSELTGGQHTLNTRLTTNKNDKKVYTLIFEHWNAQGIIKHRALTDKMRRTINGRLKEGYGLEDITKAIDNYAAVLSGPGYFFSYRWTLTDFLARGLERFIDEARPLENFTRDKGGAGTCRNASAPYPRSEMSISTLESCGCPACRAEIERRGS